MIATTKVATGGKRVKDKIISSFANTVVIIYNDGCASEEKPQLPFKIM